MNTPIEPISDEQLAELEYLCGKATQGKWWIDSHGVTMMAMDSLEVVFTTPCDPKTAVRHPETGNLSNWRNDWDASYIATACPSKVQGLIARLRAAESLLTECRPVVAREVERWTRAATILPVNANVESFLLKRIDAAMERKP